MTDTLTYYRQRAASATARATDATDVAARQTHRLFARAYAARVAALETAAAPEPAAAADERPR